MSEVLPWAGVAGTMTLCILAAFFLRKVRNYGGEMWQFWFLLQCPLHLCFFLALVNFGHIQVFCWLSEAVGVVEFGGTRLTWNPGFLMKWTMTIFARASNWHAVAYMGRSRITSQTCPGPEHVRRYRQLSLQE